MYAMQIYIYFYDEKYKYKCYKWKIRHSMSVKNENINSYTAGKYLLTNEQNHFSSAYYMLSWRNNGSF